jgi:hypothetical protein
MNVIKAFVGYSFSEEDEDTISRFHKYFDSLKGTIGFEYDHAEKAEANTLSQKVRAKIEGKNLFIGIFTKKGRKIKSDKLKKFGGKLYASKNEFKAATSEWIIQESGYGLAKCGNLLFLVEDGIDISAGLHGDIEYIKFNKEFPERCFTKTTEYIGNLRPYKNTEKGPEEKSIPPKDTTKKNSEPEKQEDQISDPETKKSMWIESFSALWELVVQQQDFPKAEQKLDAIIEQYKDDKKFNHIWWKCTYLKLKCQVGESDGIEKLLNFCELYPDEPYPFEVLGVSYNNYEKFTDSLNYYLLAAEKSSNLAEKIRLTGHASESCAQNGDFLKAYDLLFKLLIDRTLSLSESKIFYKKLCNVAKIEENNTLYTCFAEKVLDFDPADTDTRFSLAYKYSEINNNNLSLYHYKMLCDIKPNGTNSNNIEVVYGELSLKNKSVSAFKDAADDYNETQAADSQNM